jgi:hypothetical protein
MFGIIYISNDGYIEIRRKRMPSFRVFAPPDAGPFFFPAHASTVLCGIMNDLLSLKADVVKMTD